VFGLSVCLYVCACATSLLLTSSFDIVSISSALFVILGYEVTVWLRAIELGLRPLNIKPSYTCKKASC